MKRTEERQSFWTMSVRDRMTNQKGTYRFSTAEIAEVTRDILTLRGGYFCGAIHRAKTTRIFEDSVVAADAIQDELWR